MTDDPLVALLAKALQDLVNFVDTRPEDATEDDDVRALESVAYTLQQAAAEDRARLASLLGEKLSGEVGLDT